MNYRKPLLGLTEPQKQLYEYLLTYIEANNCAPSYRQMLGAMGLKSLSAVQARLKRLHRHGLIRLTPRQARSVQIISSPDVESA